MHEAEYEPFEATLRYYVVVPNTSFLLFILKFTWIFALFVHIVIFCNVSSTVYFILIT